VLLTYFLHPYSSEARCVINVCDIYYPPNWYSVYQYESLQHVFLDKMQTRHVHSLYRNNIVFVIYGPAVIYRVCMFIKYMCYCHKNNVNIHSHMIDVKHRLFFCHKSSTGANKSILTHRIVPGELKVLLMKCRRPYDIL